MSRKICVVTATRAEYGCLKPLIEDIQADNDLVLQLICTGTHLSPEFGYTKETILNDRFSIAKSIEIVLSSDSAVGASKSMGLAQISFAEAFDELKPDILVVIGDRFELLPIVSAASLAAIPVAHISGGELTEGAIDELIRHSITKLSQLHFTAMNEYSKRVIQMGEHPSRVFTVGELGLDNLLRMQLMDKIEFEKSIGRALQKNNYLVTYHPETTQSKDEVKRDFNQVLNCLSLLEDSLIIITKANADVGGRLINKMIDEFVELNATHAIAFTSLGQHRYLSSLQFIDAVIGNSSSGIHEAPSFKVPTINIGDRQKGRVKAASIIDINANQDELKSALNYISTPEFNTELKKVENPYGRGNTSTKIMEVLKQVDFDTLKKKGFYDISFSF